MPDSSNARSGPATLVLCAALFPTFAACGPEPVDLLLTNGRVYTLDWGEPAADGTPAADAPYSPDRGWRPDAQAVAVHGGRIVFVGDSAEARGYAGPDTENLRRARATDTYILRGEARTETWEPRFTSRVTTSEWSSVAGLSEKTSCQ